jgi:MFS family permease
LNTAAAEAESALAPKQPPVTTPRHTTFGSLRNRNFRLFASGQIVSNTGAWVQRIAQDWLVLSLTGNATAVGFTTGLQFLPTLLFGLLGGLIADRYPKRRVLLATQVGMASMAAVLAVLTLTHRVAAWHVYLVAFGLGTVTAIDNPARQAFANEMVGPDRLRNAISINSSVFQLAALIGPAISGLLIDAVGAGYAFAANAVGYLAPIVALLRIREDELVKTANTGSAGVRIADAVRYLADRPHMLWPTVLAGVFGLFTTNLPVTLAAFARSVFHSGPAGYGLLSSVVAIGSLTGALVSARRRQTRLRGLAATCLVLAALEMTAAAAPNQWSFCIVIAGVGTGTLLLLTAANSMVQLGATDAIRGRVMGLYLLVFIGSGALGGPLVGSVDQRLGPQAGMLLAGAVPAAATLVIAVNLARRQRLARTRPRLACPSTVDG